VRPLLVVLCLACSAAPRPPDLSRAEYLEHDGLDSDALAAYARAATRCDHQVDQWCAAALLGSAATLERLGRHDDAATAYENIPLRIAGRDADSAAAWVEAGRIRLAQHRDARAYELFWRVITEFPDESAADDALRHVVGDGRRRNPRQLYETLMTLYARLAKSELGDNLLWHLASLARDDLHDAPAALADLDRLAAVYPESPLRDDALWNGGRLARAAGDFEGALRRWRALLRTREEALILGSYHSVYLDDAQLEVGRLLRDDLHRPADALVEFRLVEKDYPRSTLIDDSLWEIAATEEQLGDKAAACATLADLVTRFPESKYAPKAPVAAARLGCHG
jgi:tetratricopeptide (TPR) repeat protein